MPAKGCFKNAGLLYGANERAGHGRQGTYNIIILDK